MGQSGTDVAKETSDLILTDDNFSTIVSAVREGRGIYENIRKTIHFLISCNIGEIITILVAFILECQVLCWQFNCYGSIWSQIRYP